MFNTIFDKGSIPALEQMLYFTRARHEILANNIANVETPFYKAQDAPADEFREALLGAMEEARQYWVPTVEFNGSKHVDVKSGGGLRIHPMEELDLAAPLRADSLLRHDLNNVDVDVEFAKMSKNASLHNAVASILNQQFDLLHSAISERV